MTTLAPDQVLKTYFLVSAALAFLSSSIPSIQKRFAEYGSRAVGGAGLDKKSVDSKDKGRGSPAMSGTSIMKSIEPKDKLNGPLEDSIPTLLRAISLKVPHRYFTHFYIASIASSVFWGFQFLTFGRPLRVILDLQSASQPQDTPSMSRDQVLLVWAMLLVQGARRCYESVVFARSSRSEMWIALYGVGISFYLVTGMAIWIDGTPALQDHGIRLVELVPIAPSVRTLICIPVFILASGIQHDCHSYLASLEKYTLPVHPGFSSVVCPHYTAELVIFASLAIIAAPAGRLVNPTLLTTFIFTVVNLGATADSSKAWYAREFGVDSVKGKWRMIPWVF